MDYVDGWIWVFGSIAGEYGCMEKYGWMVIYGWMNGYGWMDA
jgi:hypothetical protein